LHGNSIELIKKVIESLAKQQPKMRGVRDFSGIWLQGANLDNANFEGANLQFANFCGVKNINYANFKDIQNIEYILFATTQEEDEKIKREIAKQSNLKINEEALKDFL
jgi:uncharacterized protein YjbI with pentapeptide repeats